MRILVLSDLHRELWRQYAPRIDTSISKPDVVILAGDIDKGARSVAWAAENFKGIPTCILAGNHEYYGGKIESVQKELRDACAQTENVHFLDCDEFILDDVRFLRATLWTDFCLFGSDQRQAAMRAGEAAMNDYKLIRLAESGYRKLRAADTARFHANHKKWLQDKLMEPFAGKTVVVTHMAPSMKSVASEFESDIVSACYASNLDDLVANADVWIHGHMHSTSDYMIEGCRVVCNPLGYMNKSGGPENFDWDPNFVLGI